MSSDTSFMKEDKVMVSRSENGFGPGYFSLQFGSVPPSEIGNILFKLQLMHLFCRLHIFLFKAIHYTELLNIQLNSEENSVLD